MDKNKRVVTLVNVSFKNYQKFYFAYIFFQYWDFLFIEEKTNTKMFEKLQR